MLVARPRSSPGACNESAKAWTRWERAMDVDAPEPSHRQLAIERAFAEINEDTSFGTEGQRPLRRRGSPSPLAWSDLLQSARVLVISQTGSGKTYECQRCQRRLWDKGEPAFLVELAELAANKLGDLLSPEEEQRLEQWRVSQSGVATFFLDSVDELKLTQGSFKTTLTRLAKAINGQFARVRVVVTSRPVPFDRDQIAAILPVPSAPEAQPTAADFADIAMGMAKTDSADEQAKPWRTVELLPLSDEQIMLFASGQGVGDPEAFLADIHRRNAIEFAERPQDLIELCAVWRDHQRIGSHRAQVAGAIASKLTPRTDRRERAELSPDRAYEGASRLALAAMLMRRLTFRHSPESDVGGPPGTAIDPAEILPNWTADERATLLERALFGFASYGRVRFHHRSVLEHLAAKRLGQHLASSKPIAAVKRLLFAETPQADRIVRPTMRPVAAWLALESESVFADVIERDPTVMLNFGDPDALSDAQKARALSVYVARYGRGGWRGLRVPAIQIHRFASPGLAPLVHELWPIVENVEVRELLLDLIGAAEMETCAGLAAEAALSAAEPVQLRISALDALIRLDDPRLTEVVRSLEAEPAKWPMEIVRPAVVRLFPDHIAPESLFRVLARLTDQRYSASYLTYHLPERIAAIVDGPKLDAVVQGLAILVSEGLVRSQEWPPYKSHRPFLLPALAAACARRMATGPLAPCLAQSVALALRLAGHRDESDRHLKTLRERVAMLGPGDREMLFWIEDGFRQSMHPLTDPGRRFWEAAREGPIRLDAKRDTAWIRAAVGDKKRPIPEREMMLDGALCHVWDRQEAWEDHARRLRADVADQADLVAVVDRQLEPVPINPELLAHEADWKKREKKEARQKARNHASWMHFWGELANSPDEAFGSGRSTTTAWNLWRAMSQSGPESRSSGWDRRFLERHFGAAVADKMRLALRPVWREGRPTLWTEREPGKRNTYLSIWQLGLAAIAAEAEDKAWATKLTLEEARLACRYAPIQLNGLPSWLGDLAAAYPAEVQKVFEVELEAELREPAGIDTSGLLTSIGLSSPDLKALFRPCLLTWLADRGDLAEVQENGTAAIARLDSVLEILMQDEDETFAHQLRQHALAHLESGIVGPVANTWLSALMKLDPAAGTAALESALDGLAPVKNGPAVELLAALFGDHHSTRAILASGPGFTPPLLLRLLTLAYRHVRIADDDRHEGAFTPDTRDNAQHARNALLDAMLQAKGPDGWAAKLELAASPWFAHMRDRVLLVAHELAAEEVDGQPATAAAVISLERYGEAPPATRDDMFQLICDRLDDLDDFLLQDISPRELWAGTQEERVLRRAIAQQLKAAANGVYTVDQEAVTADEKETDIRLRSTLPGQEGVIELKVGEKNRSAAELRQALSDQLVRKYMAPENCRAGCLLITIRTNRNWKHPDSGEVLDLAGLIGMLNKEARRITDELGGTLRISARGLNLRPRIGPERDEGVAKRSKAATQ